MWRIQLKVLSLDTLRSLVSERFGVSLVETSEGSRPKKARHWKGGVEAARHMQYVIGLLGLLAAANILHSAGFDDIAGPH